MDFIDLKAQYKAYKSEIDAAINSVLESAQFIMGGAVANFQKELENYTGAKHALACSSGSDALLLSLMALDIKPGEEVITTPFTFIATAEMVAFLGAVPVFVDICQDSYNIDVNAIESAITAKTRAIMPVSLYGVPADMESINKLAKKHNLAVIEDACQSFGATIDGKKSCNLSGGVESALAATSFFPSKPLGCYGDGGAVFTNDSKLAEKIAQLLNHGQSERYKHKYIGINGRLDAIQCAILSVKLRHLDAELEARENIAACYMDNLEGYILPKIPNGVKSAWAQFSLRHETKERAKILETLAKENIPTAIHYPTPLHLQEAFAYLKHKKGDFPVAEKIANEIFSIPFGPFLDSADQEKIISALNLAAK